MRAFDFTVSVVIFDAAGGLLLIHENDGRWRRGFPGGRVEPCEGIAEAVMREVRGEPCCRTAVDHLTGVLHVVETRHQACTPPSSSIRA